MKASESESSPSMSARCLSDPDRLFPRHVWSLRDFEVISMETVDSKQHIRNDNTATANHPDQSFMVNIRWCFV